MSDPVEPSGSNTYQILQPHRDPESNWSVDVANNLEEYLLKICSGDVNDDDHVSVNFAEAALLIQGSVQVYSKKVEYLYSLVVNALEFLSQKRQQDQTENSSVQPDLHDSQSVIDDDNEPFLDLDDVPVEPKNSLDGGLSKDDGLRNFIKPPPNLVVLEGDCFNTTGESGELESYLLATYDLYQDFILLDPCDAEAINNFMSGHKAGTSNTDVPRDTSVRSKTLKGFVSPTRRSAHKSLFQETQDADLNRTPVANCSEVNRDPLDTNLPEYEYHGDADHDGYSEPVDEPDDANDDDVWKVLNPHEPGNLKVKPFRKIKVPKKQRINFTKQISLASKYPLARLHGTISPELAQVWEAQFHSSKRQQEPQSPPYYEKLRQSLNEQGPGTFSTYSTQEDVNEDDGYENDFPDFEQADVVMPDDTNRDEDLPLNPEKFADDFFHSDQNIVFGVEDHEGHTSLEDLCRSHMDALLISIAETQKQSELASRVATWKLRIESTLDEQDSRPPFDIHEYGERVLDKLSIEDSETEMSFADVVRGQEKHEVARSFSALLQLVNNGNVSLDRDESISDSLCYTVRNPFRVRLLEHKKRREEVQLCSSRKRVKSPIRKHRSPHALESTSSGTTPQENGKYSVKLGKVTSVRCTPEGKRRRKSRFADDVESAG